MRIAFMGSPDFAVPALRALHDAGHTIVTVYCRQPQPAGRGYAIRQSPVQQEAARLGLPVRTPIRLRGNAEEHQAFAAFGLDAAVVAAYGLILPETMLSAPGRGCLNIHASLLPRWRGASPIQAAIKAGDTTTGVTIMRMDTGLDTGPILLQAAVPIGERTTAAQLHDTLAALGARLIVRALAEAPAPASQPAEGVSYAPKLTRDAGRIDWTRDAAAIERQMRAFDPWPGSFTTLNGSPLKIHAALLTVHSGSPGAVLDDRLTVGCGRGALRLTKVQLPGRPAMPADAFLRGHPLPAGSVLGG
jgi:methionyl-tRNA formyltransferase